MSGHVRWSLRSRSPMIGVAIVVIAVLTAAPSAVRAQDFFSSLFGGFNPPPRAALPPLSLPFAVEGDVAARPQPRSSGGGGQAYCVRTCDGRYFPLSGPSNASRAESCSSLCPAAETKVFYGGAIDSASSAGRSYSELPNAFRYRKEIVGGCTCNGKDQFGLAKIGIDDDPTLRKGDVVSGTDGLMVARRVDHRRGDLELSPAAASVRARFARPPIVAAD